MSGDGGLLKVKFNVDENLSGTSTNPVRNSTITEKFNEFITDSRVGTEIYFYRPEIYNTSASPATANITNNLTGAKLGVVQKIYHNHTSIPTFPASWVRIGEGEYIVNVLNIVYAEWCGGTRVEYWIIQQA
jgi:hypothetical protein